MDHNSYLKNLLYALIFFSLIYFLALLGGKDFLKANIYYFSYAALSSLLFPFAISLVREMQKNLLALPHWNRWVGFLCLVLAIPLGLIYLIRK